ncbi:MAG TPA: helix-turn-helix domain-containing protein [Ktedonobacterales bacterium]|nr:helix-turn-helix domain-containing protein [Ktedonobacterales bacterium]
MAESDEYMTVAEARDALGVSKRKIAQLIDEGVLPAEPNTLDKRSKVVKRADVEALKKRPGVAASAKSAA